ncbi:MAG: amylo-alpha-1,6-glucosidase [Desulfobacterales bacterium]|nr:amylo-alpha-1,6-glucosidase [Desulfobacterales bacterium]
MKSVLQTPAPGQHLLMFRGDTLEFKLSLPTPQKGTAWIRTNIGHSDVARGETLAAVRENIPALDKDWFDIAMRPVDDRTFGARLPLTEVGHFEAKCFFLKDGETDPVWPEGPNTGINVEPAHTCCGNIIYNAFVRQFGANKAAASSSPVNEDWIKALDSSGYTVIPKSGTFRDLIRELDFIVGTLGCRILQLLPVHPVPTTYGRMGRFGSPYAALSFTAVDPALAEFDYHATPLEQFIELIDAVHARYARIFIDIAINHTGWAASLHETHPQWLSRDPDGRIEVPGAWGVSWEDLTKLNYSHKDLWQFMADVFLTWCRRGVDGFRCDAGYMIPVPAWKYLIAAVREQFPDTVFLLEGLGGKISVTRELLNTANFNWAYSELFQNYDRGQIEGYLPGAMEISGSDGVTVHFAETHDNPRLAAQSHGYARMRTALCALFSHQGAFGFSNGVEWFAAEKIDVHGAASLNWGAQPNQIDLIGRLTTLLTVHPAFFNGTRLALIQTGEGNVLALLRHHGPSNRRLIILVNLDVAQRGRVSWDPSRAKMAGGACWDLMTGAAVEINRKAGMAHCGLEPGQVICLSDEKSDLALFIQTRPTSFALPPLILNQRLRAKGIDVYGFYHGVRDLAEFDPDGAAGRLAQDPFEFCRSLNPDSQEPRVVKWQWPQDAKREVMIPPNHFLLLQAAVSFRAEVLERDRVLRCEESLVRSDGTFFALLTPLPPQENHRRLTVKLSLYADGRCEHVEARLLLLARAGSVSIKNSLKRSDLVDQPALLLQTNGCGAMLRASIRWGELRSRYDALLSANLNPEYPEDRWAMLARYRIWLVYQGYSQAVNGDCFDSFYRDGDSTGCWRFYVPAGQGQYTLLTIQLQMVSGKNAVRMILNRHPAGDAASRLTDGKPVRLIVRPDIESRNFHEPAKAFKGPENIWPKATTPHSDHFLFSALPEHPLRVRISRGEFVWEPEWQYMVFRPADAERGLDPDSDLFSPGYFQTELKGEDQVELTAVVLDSSRGTAGLLKIPGAPPVQACFEKEETFFRPIDDLTAALRHYVVRRGDLKTVIAGYPWFLDWGRDALIFTRGLIAAGKTAEARDIIKLFGQYEENGTLPNMIRGADAGNRDTSDAALWFFTVCADMVRAEGKESFLDEPCGNRSVRQVLIAMVRSLMDGTPNGICMDPDSGLLFSPSHFTWMDTNHPAGTPREGYPVEIQSLWIAGLLFLAQIDASKAGGRWQQLSLKARSSLLELFPLRDEGYMSDCLHAGPGTPARQAKPDDALRPNQLLALTLGAVGDDTRSRKILSACEELLVPGAIRSLADRPLKFPLPIVHQGRALNDPGRPYQGKYAGDEDLQRKPAYHNGTAWTWMFPSFCEAWVAVYGDNARETALSWLSSSSALLHQGCVGHLPEIIDGDFPHISRGCDAQAWGASEWVRVWMKLKAS